MSAESPKTALVFGAGGFLGQHLVESLVRDGYFVRGFGKSECPNTLAHEYIVGDARDLSAIEKAFHALKLEEVYQMAAEMGGATHVNTGLYDADIMSNSVLINVNIAKCCVKYGAKKLFFPSSACVYPDDTSGTALCREKDAYPAHPDMGYGWEKIFTEQMLLSYNRQYRLEVRIARLHSIIGDGSRWCNGREKAHSALARKVAMVENGGTVDVIGDGTQIRTFLYVTDCIAAIRKLMASECREIINIGSDIPFDIASYMEVLREISGKRFTINYIPGPVGMKMRYCNIDKAKQFIGWEPTTSLYDATRITYDFICDQMKLPQYRATEI